jgi:cellulase/cellobiase CelA1
VAFTLPAGHGFVNQWSADFGGSGQSVTAGHLSWNGNLGPGGSTEFGFQASRPNGQLPAGFTCTAT